MPDPNILIISDPCDDQAKLIYEAIAEKNENTHFILFNGGTEFSAKVNNKNGFSIEISGREFSEIDAVYARLKYGDATMDVGNKFGVASLQQTEWNGFARAIQSMFADGNIIPFAPDPAGYKLRQLVLAREAGFTIPQSVVAMGKSRALSFVQTYGHAVLKNLNSPRFIREDLKPSALIATRVLSEDVADTEAAEFDVCPVFLQEEIRGQRELRTISFLNRTFTYEQIITVQHENVVDKRMFWPTHRLIETPRALHEKISRFLSRSGLRYGVFDILERDGDFVFLECNLDGQWHSANEHNVDEVLGYFVAMVLDVATSRWGLRNSKSRHALDETERQHFLT